MSYNIRRLERSDDPDVASIIRNVWGGASLRRFEFLLHWFRQREVRFGLSACQDLVVEKGGKIVGYTRMIPCKYLLAGEVVNASQMTDNVTSPDHRGCGVKLFRSILSLQDVLLIGIPVARSAILWERLCSQKVKVASVRRCVLLIRPSVFLRQKKFPASLSWLADKAWRMRRSIGFAIQGRSGTGTLVLDEGAVALNPDEFDALWQEFSRDFYLIAIRNHDFMRWRFLESPFSYRYLWLRAEGVLVGYSVFKLLSIRGRKVLLIVEMIAVGDKTRHYSMMLERLSGIGEDAGVSDLQALYSGCDQMWQAMRGVGAVLRTEKEDVLAFMRSDRPSARDMYHGKACFFSLAESDHEFVMYPPDEGLEWER